ncbi:MAG: SDR family oxidoreductase [Pseudomonadota bacterium]
MTGVAIITGAGSGIGAATTGVLLAEGWRVALLGRRLERLEVVAGNDSNAICIATDVADEAAVDAAFQQVLDHFGRLDLLFNNAGTGLAAQMIDEVDATEWRRILEVNLTGSFLCARAAFGIMRRQNPMGGRIINNGSISAHAPRPGSVCYTATKHAISGVTKTLALDGRAFNIACGQIDIGNALTDIAAPLKEGALQPRGDIIPEPVMDPVHAANAVLHMASLPLDANVLSMTVMARDMPFVGRG